jgi:hypothetical protein
MLKREAYFQFEMFRSRVNHHAELAVKSQSGHNSLASAADALPELPAHGSSYIDRRKLRPPSYRPTTLKGADTVPMQANPEAVKRELGRIRSSLNMRGRR